MKSIKSFFESIHVMHWAIVGAIVCFAVNTVAKVMMGSYISAIAIAIAVPCFMVLGFSYYQHNKNVMKAMIGAIIMWYVMDEIFYLGYVYAPSVSSPDGAYNNAAGIAYIIIEGVIIALLIYLFINHFIINSDHHSRPSNIIQNQIISMLIAVLAIVQIFVTIASTGASGPNVMEIISWQIAQIAFTLSIVCIESKLDAYKVQRENK